MLDCIEYEGRKSDIDRDRLMCSQPTEDLNSQLSESARNAKLTQRSPREDDQVQCFFIYLKISFYRSDTKDNLRSTICNPGGNLPLKITFNLDLLLIDVAIGHWQIFCRLICF